MAADQRRKRPNAVGIADGSSQEQFRNKRKKLESSGSDLHSKSHISLEWNAHRNKVVARKEQVAMSRRNLRPFIDSTPHSRNILADVFAIPPEVFQLENLTGLLSYEVWQSLLSDKERNYLMQFLPKGQDAEQIVQALLNEENFNFGSPFLDWGVSLCFGDLHPDAVVRHEQELKAEKEVYYSEIQNYHHGMIEYLQKLKEKWEGNQDPEPEIVQKAWSKTRRESEKRVSKKVKKSRVFEVEQDITNTSESSSWMADEKACSSDNQNSPMMKKRTGEKEKGRKQMTATDTVLNVGRKQKKGAKLQRSNVHYNDGSEHMSYIKVTKSQYEQIKNMKQCKNIQSLNRVLGNPDSLLVQPYEVFLKEEQEKMHEHWLQLAKEDLPRAYANWRGRQVQREDLMKALEQDMKDELNILETEEKEESESMAQDVHCESETQSDSEEKERCPNEDNKFDSEIESEEENDDADEEKDDVQNVLVHTKSESDMENDDGEDSQNDEEEELQNDKGITPGEDMLVHEQGSSATNQFLQPITCVNGSLDEFNTMVMEPDKTPKCYDVVVDDEEEEENLNAAVDVSVSREARQSSCDVWPTMIGMPPHSYHETSARHNNEYASALPLVVGEKQCSPALINLESDFPGRNLITNGDAFNNSYTRNQDRNELLQSLFNNQGVLSFNNNNHEQKRPDVEFQAPLPPPPHNVMMPDGRYFQKRQNDIFMPENNNNNIYPGEGSRFMMPPRQEQFPASNNVPEWNTNDLIHISSSASSLQPNLNGGELLSQNWFHGEHQLRGVGSWNGPNLLSNNVPSHTMGSNGDQSLYSVLSQQQQQRPCYDSMGGSTTLQFNNNAAAISRNNYNISSMVGLGAPNPHGLGGISVLPPQVSTNPPPPLDYFGGRNHAPTTSSLIMPDEIMGWPNMHDPMGKPYLRSWNQ